jgi:hypothetical protein
VVPHPTVRTATLPEIVNVVIFFYGPVLSLSRPNKTLIHKHKPADLGRWNVSLSLGHIVPRYLLVEGPAHGAGLEPTYHRVSPAGSGGKLFRNENCCSGAASIPRTVGNANNILQGAVVPLPATILPTELGSDSKVPVKGTFFEVDEFSMAAVAVGIPGYSDGNGGGVGVHSHDSLLSDARLGRYVNPGSAFPLTEGSSDYFLITNYGIGF